MVPERDRGRLLACDHMRSDPEDPLDRDHVPGDVRRTGRRRDVHPDDIAVGLEQRAAGVSGNDVGVHLDQLGEPVRSAGLLVGHGDRVVGVGDRPGGRGQRTAVTTGVPDRGHVLPHSDPTDVGGGRRETGRVLELQDGDVPLRVGAEHLGVVGPAGRDHRDPDRRRTLDHVVVGHDESVAADDDAAAGGLAGPELDLTRDGHQARRLLVGGLGGVEGRGGRVRRDVAVGARVRRPASVDQDGGGRGRRDGGDGQRQDEGRGGRRGEGALHAGHESGRDRHDLTVEPEVVGPL